MEDVYNFNNLPKLDVKDDPVEYRRFYDQSSGFTAQNTPVQNHFTFRISDINSYWLLHRAYLLVQFELDAPAGGPNERATLANGIGNIFERVKLRLGDTLIEDKPRHFYRDYEIDAMTWHKQYAETLGSVQMYHNRSVSDSAFRSLNLSRAVYEVPGGGSNTIEPNNFDVPGTPESRNLSLTRQNPTYCMIPLFHIFNFTKVYQKVIRGLDVECEFYISSDNVKLIRSLKQSDNVDAVAGQNYVFKWAGSGLSLYIPRIKPTPQMEGQLNSMLIKGVSPMVEFEKSIVYREAIPIGRQDGEWSITTNTSTPTRLYLFLRTQSSESIQTVPLYERKSFLERLDVYVNGERIPTEDVKAEGTANSGLVQRNYTQYFRQWHNMQGNFDGLYNGSSGGSQMSYLEFDLNSVIAFDLKQNTRDLIDKSSDIRVTYKLDDVAVSSHWLYAVLFSKSVVTLEMSEQRSVALVK